jgi:hypothetical protein
MNEPEIVYIRLTPGDGVPDRTFNVPFKAVIVADLAAAGDWQTEIAMWVVTQGCLYAMCWGVDCELWEESVDWVQVDIDLASPERSDECFVMTTQHSGEALTDAFEFSWYCATDPYTDLDTVLILHISDTDRSSELIDAYGSAQHSDE